MTWRDANGHLIEIGSRVTFNDHYWSSVRGTVKGQSPPKNRLGLDAILLDVILDSDSKYVTDHPVYGRYMPGGNPGHTEWSPEALIVLTVSIECPNCGEAFNIRGDYLCEPCRTAILVA